MRVAFVPLDIIPGAAPGISLPPLALTAGSTAGKIYYAWARTGPGFACHDAIDAWGLPPAQKP